MKRNKKREKKRNQVIRMRHSINYKHWFITPITRNWSSFVANGLKETHAQDSEEISSTSDFLIRWMIWKNKNNFFGSLLKAINRKALGLNVYLYIFTFFLSSNRLHERETRKGKEKWEEK